MNETLQIVIVVLILILSIAWIVTKIIKSRTITSEKCRKGRAKCEGCPLIVNCEKREETKP